MSTEGFYTHNNGMAFKLARSERGLSPYALLEAAWTLPCILYGLRHQIWKLVPSTEVLPHPALVLWIEMGLIETTPDEQNKQVHLKLTESGCDFVGLKSLFEYEWSMMEQQLKGDRKTDPEKYRTLRTSLAYYARTYLQPLTDWIIEHSIKKRILDFGGGDGFYLMTLLQAAESDSSGVLYDKAPGLSNEIWEQNGVEIVEENFLEKGAFANKHQHEFDTIIVSEVLHCLSPEETGIALAKLARLLSEDGTIFIIEQNNSFRMDWRLHDMTNGGHSMDGKFIVDTILEAEHLELEAFQTVQGATHHIVCVQHKEVKNVTIN